MPVSYKIGDPIGDYGSVFIGDAPPVIFGGKPVRMGVVRCVCGDKRIASLKDVRLNRAKSCGCLKKAHPMARIYNSMVGRCHRESDTNYHKYGAKGIIVCDEWRKDRQSFFDWCDTQDYQGKQIDRIDNRLGYNPDNCRFVSASENVRNRSNSVIWITPRGEFGSLKDAEREYSPGVRRWCDDGKDGFGKRSVYK